MIYGSSASARGGRRLAASLAFLGAALVLAAQSGVQSDSGLDGAELRRAASPPYGSALVPATSWGKAIPPGLGPQNPAAPAALEALALEVDEAVALALEKNIGLAANRLETETKRRKSELAWNAFLPSVDLGLTTNRWNLEQSARGLSPYSAVPYELALPRWNLSASLSATLLLNAALFENLDALRLDYEAGLISYAQARSRLEREVRKGFYSLLLIRENMALMEQNLATAERRFAQATANYRAGLAPELTMLQARVAWENMKPALEELRIGYASSLDAFAMTLGLPRGTRLEPRGKIDPAYLALSADELVAKRLGERLDIQALVKAIESLSLAERATRFRLKTPSLVLGWNWDPAFGGDPFKDPLFGDEEHEWKQRSGMFRATLSLSLNAFFPWSKEAQGLEEMKEGIEGLRAGLALSIRGAETEIDSIVRKLEKSRTSKKALELNVDLAERAYRLAEEAYKAGSRDLLDAQAAELELRKAQLGLLTEEYNYVTGLLDLEYALSLPFGSLSKEGN